MAAQILSHHVDTFPLVAAFFLFSIACLNMLLGLIFRESAKQRRSISSWRSDTKGILPTSMDNRPVFVNTSPAFVSSHFTGKSNGSSDDEYYGDEKPRSLGSFRTSEEKASLGFGRQAEKAAGLRGFILQRPEESLPRYASPVPPRTTSPPPRAPSPVTMPRPESPTTLSRHVSIRSSSSSFSSPARDSAAPVFKSSPTAL